VVAFDVRGKVVCPSIEQGQRFSFAGKRIGLVVGVGLFDADARATPKPVRHLRARTAVLPDEP
jgi:hypothetical protein